VFFPLSSAFASASDFFIAYIDAIPAAAKATILKKVAGGKLRTVETFQKPGPS
jgi:hypothetical protein